MKKILMPLLIMACLILTACSDDNEPKTEFSGEYLEATTWDATLTGSTYPDRNPISSHFVMQYLTKNSGKCIPTYGDTDFTGDFTYRITKEMITFNGCLTGNWTVIEQTKTMMVLQSFQPYEFNLVLTRK